MRVWFLRVVTFVAFIGWLVMNDRLHRYQPDDRDEDEREYDDSFHTEGFA